MAKKKEPEVKVTVVQPSPPHLRDTMVRNTRRLIRARICNDKGNVNMALAIDLIHAGSALTHVLADQSVRDQLLSLAAPDSKRALLALFDLMDEIQRVNLEVINTNRGSN